MGEEQVAQQVGQFCLQIWGQGLGHGAAIPVAEFPESVLGPDQSIHPSDLMFMEQVGQEVAGGHGIALEGETRTRLQGCGTEFALIQPTHPVAPVPVEATRAGDVPTAEALRQRLGVSGLAGMEGVEAAAAGSGSHGFHGQSGDLERVLIGVAVHAAPGPFDHHPRVTAGNVEDVEDSPQLGINRRHFNFPAGHVAQIQIVAEVEGPGIVRVDEAQLEAGVGEDQQLGRLRYVQRSQQAFQKGPFAGAVQRKAARGQFRNAATETIDGRSLEIAVGLGVEIRFPLRRTGGPDEAYELKQPQQRHEPLDSSADSPFPMQCALHGVEGVIDLAVGQTS